MEQVERIGVRSDLDPAHRPTRLLIWTILYAIVALLPAHPGWISVFEGGWGPLLAALALLLAFLLLDRGVRTHLVSRRDWPLALLVAGLASGLIGPTDPTERIVAGRTFWHASAALVVVYLLAKGVMLDRPLRPRLVQVAALFGGAVALYGLAEFAAGSNPLFERFWPNVDYATYAAQRRPIATQFNPVPLGTLMALSIAWTLVAARHAGDAGRPRARRLWLALAAGELACLLLTLSRGPLLALVAMGACLLVLTRRWRSLAAAAALFLVLVSIASLLPTRFTRFGFRTLFAGASGVVSQFRIERVEMAWRMFEQSGGVGLGFRQFHFRFAEYYPRPEALGAWTIPAGDNMYVTLLAEAGAAGALGLVLFLAVFARRAWRFDPERIPPGERALAGALGAMVAGFVVSLAHYDLLYLTGPLLLLAASFGLLAGFEEDALRGESNEVGGESGRGERI